MSGEAILGSPGGDSGKSGRLEGHAHTGRRQAMRAAGVLGSPLVDIAYEDA